MNFLAYKFVELMSDINICRISLNSYFLCDAVLCITNHWTDFPNGMEL